MIELPRIGFGAASIAQDGVGLGEGIDCVHAAWESGLRYFDTAPMYGSGHSERLLGLALRGRPRSEYVLSTKVGRLVRPWHPDTAQTGESWIYDFSRDGVLTSIEESLLRLGVDSVDMLYLHDPDDHWQQALDEAWPTVAQLRAEGLLAPEVPVPSAPGG